MENQGNTMKDTVVFYFDDIPLKLASNRFQKRKTTSQWYENSLFDFYNSIHIARNIHQILLTPWYFMGTP